MKHKVTCKDCGMPYGEDNWMDTVLSNDQWKLIAPESKEHDFILCANCIVKRAHKIGAITAQMKLMFEEDYE